MDVVAIRRQVEAVDVSQIGIVVAANGNHSKLFSTTSTDETGEILNIKIAKSSGLAHLHSPFTILYKHPQMVLQLRLQPLVQTRS
jgi:hypothetical protein